MKIGDGGFRSIRAEELLAGFNGYLTADAYERIGELRPGVFKARSWVHARRKFEACHHLGLTARKDSQPILDSLRGCESFNQKHGSNVSKWVTD